MPPNGNDFSICECGLTGREHRTSVLAEDHPFTPKGTGYSWVPVESLTLDEVKAALAVCHVEVDAREVEASPATCNSTGRCE